MNQQLANRDALGLEEWETRRQKGDSLQRQKSRKLHVGRNQISGIASRKEKGRKVGRATGKRILRDHLFVEMEGDDLK